jgi:hypothetical protein
MHGRKKGRKLPIKVIEDSEIPDGSPEEQRVE